MLYLSVGRNACGSAAWQA